MTEIITITEKDRHAWNEFVARHKLCHYAQSYEWGELKRAEGWNPIRLGVEASGKIVAGVAMLEKKLPLIGKSIFYAPRGPLVSLDDYRRVELLMEGIKDVARRHKAIFLRVDPYERENGSAEVKDMILRLGFRETGMDWSTWNVPRITQINDLPPDCESLFNSFRPKVRRDIRLPYKRGATVVEDASESTLREFYEILKDTARWKGFAVRDYYHFEVLRREFERINSFKFFIARLNGIPIAGVMCIKFGKRCWYVHGGTNSNFRNFPTSYLVQWEAIKTAIEEGCEIYDFGGTPVNYPPRPSDVGYGLYEFKKWLGGKLVQLVGYFDFVFDPVWYKVFTGAERHILPRAYTNYARYKNTCNFLRAKLRQLT